MVRWRPEHVPHLRQSSGFPPRSTAYAKFGCTQASPFSAVSFTFIIDVQLKLQPDPTKMTTAYTVNNPLSPDAGPGAITRTGPPPVVTVQSLLYASLTTSLCRVSRDARKTVSQPISPEPWGPIFQSPWDFEMMWTRH